MADDSEDKPSSSKDFASTTAAVLDTFNRLKKWREEQFQQFRNKQLYECQKFCDERQKNFERVLGTTTKSPEPENVHNLFPENCNLSSISERNDSEYSDILQESSLTGHLQRCFDDSSQSNLSVTGNKVIFEAQKSPVSIESQSSECVEKILLEHTDQLKKEDTSKCSSVKPKRPFLKKGSGLLRYMSKSVTSTQRVRSKVSQKPNNSPKRNPHVAQKTLQLKPAIRSTSASSESVKHIRFDIPKDVNESSNDFGTDCSTPTVPKLLASTEENENSDKSSYSPLTSSSSPEYYFSKNNKSEAISNSGNGSLNLQSKENKELEEFEMLENCAQNSSFNSDSSVVQRVLHGERAKPSLPKENVHTALKNMNVGCISKDTSKSPSPNSIFSANMGLSKCQEEIQARKEILHKMISDINPRIQSLQTEISNCKDEALDDSDISERCSTPIEDLNVDNKILSSASPEYNSNRQSPEFLAATAAENADENLCNSDCRTCNGILKDSYSDQNSFEEQDLPCEIPDLPHQSNQAGSGKSKIQEKLQELEKEIQIYQDHNAKLASICKERDDIMRTLQKERENFEKYKETEKKKLETEIQEERRQIRRQKETFTRYQKLRRDNPTRKEREELNALRQEVEKLQEELKRQKIKYTSDSRRWKNQIDAAERERDSFKLENIRLEEQVQDLLSALRSRMKKKNSETNLSAQLDKIDEDVMISAKENSENKEVENYTQPKQLDTDNIKDPEKTVTKTTDDKKTRQKVRFNLEDKCKKDLDNRGASPESKTESLTDNLTSPQEITCEDVNHDKNIETTKKDGAAVNLSIISVSVESEFKEIDHGNKIERIYPSGEREIIFPSGTRKIIKADGVSVKFLFYNGDSKEIFPDKHEIYRYVNGVTETHFPDGLEVTEFPNGQVQRRYPDGQKEVKFPDGTSHNIYSDGSEEIHAADGNVIKLSQDGIETIEFANGQREIRTATYRRREFPDGSVKIIYDSGRQETRYSNGRIRIKDKDGKVIVDTKYAGIPKG